MKKSASEIKSESRISPYLMNLRRYGGRDDELEEARKEVLKNRKKSRKRAEKARDRLEN